MSLPSILQGTTGLVLSTWPLARAVAQAGQLGVVSGDVLPVLLARRLQLGDFDGHSRRALERFPFPGAARRVWETFFEPGGKPPQEPFQLVRQPTLDQGPALIELTLLANFTEVWLAKEGHAGPVGVHYHDRVQLPLLPALYGALLAGVDYVLVSGRRAHRVPAALDRLIQHEPADLALDIADNEGASGLTCGFDPALFGAGPPPALRRPRFLAIVSSPEHAATVLLRANSHVDGFVLEGKPPAGADRVASDEPRPVTSPQRDNGPCPDDRFTERNRGGRVAAERMRSLGVPYWLGGMSATPGAVAQAQALGAVGLQVTIPFLFCLESALEAGLKARVLELSRTQADALTGVELPSPLGAPLHVLSLDGTAADPQALAHRARLCDVGYYRQMYRKTDGSVGYRCPGEPHAFYLEKGGTADAASRQPCLCNSLLAGVGLGQIRSGGELEKALIPAGEEVRTLAEFLPPGSAGFTARDAIDRLLA